MKGGEVRKSGKRARTRERLIAVANVLFLEKGVRATSLQDIADRAGVTKGAIYSSFQSKEELVAEVIAATATALRPVLEAEMTVGEIFDALAAEAISLKTEMNARAALVAEYHLHALTNETLREKMKVNQEKAFEDVLRTAEALLPVNPVLSPRQAVLMLQALTVGFFQQQALFPSLYRDEDVAAAYRAIGVAISLRSPDGSAVG
jgi:AcrR family transcriptional regulator